jgi:DNA-directed RNA polymerase specialized sigma24 family protein
MVNSRPELPFEGPPGDAAFTTTHWSVVLASGASSTELSQAALERLCQTYWYPLYAYLRRRGQSEADAEDLVQGFFQSLLEADGFRQARRERGRFRSFLLSALNHFAANEWKRAHRIKRGGAVTFVPIQTESAEKRYGAEPIDNLTPEKIFNRRWALTVIEAGIARLRKEYASDGKVEIFEALKVYITGEEGLPTYADMAARLGKSEEAIKMAVNRLRKHYREAIRHEVAQTVESSAEVENELAELLDSLA